MFARRFYPGRYFAPRYWPARGQAATASPLVILALALGQPSTEEIAMSCATANGLRLQHNNPAELLLLSNSTVSIPLVPATASPIELQYRPTIDLALEDDHAP